MTRQLSLLAAAALAIALAAGCQPKYPKCDKDEHCRQGEFCVNGLCQQCRNDADCGAGMTCKDGRCEAPPAAIKPQCQTDADCPQNHECQQGRCVAPPAAAEGPAPCSPETIYFDFNESILTVAATRKLEANATCIKSVAGRKLRLEGHCDPRGTEEYNLALGDRRARAVQAHLKRLGVVTSRLRPVSKGKLEATGSDESGWAQDRKVQFIWE